MEYATERDWIAETSGNAAADRDEFERWALSLRGAPSLRDPQVWSYLITMADEMASIERGAYGQPYPGLENTVAAGVVARFQAEAMTPNARRARGSRVPAFRSYLKPNGAEENADYRISAARYAKGMMKLSAPSSDGFKSRAARLAHSIARGRYSNREDGYILSKAAAERFEKLYAEGWDASSWDGKLEPPVQGPSPEDDFEANRSSRLPEPPPPPAAVQSLRRSRMRDEDDDSRPFDPEERIPFGTKPHHFSYPNPGRRSQEMLPPRRPVLPPRRR